VATGPAASRFAVGADVYGIKSATDKAGGALAEYATVPEAQLAARPSSLSPAQAASLPLAGLTALQALDAARVKAGDRVLVTAAAGGVGSLAVQLAVARGATVVGTCGPRNVDFVKSIGCADALDYTRGPLAPQLADGGGFDVVLDMMGGAVEAETIKLASRPGARFQSVLNSGTSALAIAGAKVRQWVGAGPKYGVTILSVKRAGDGLRQFNDLVAAAKLAPVVAGAPRPLEEAGAAFEELKAGHVRGKLVVEV
jgi:NADPH:quinone reductase-like Zn-dependent oxidoreductase